MYINPLIISAIGASVSLGQLAFQVAYFGFKIINLRSQNTGFFAFINFYGWREGLKQHAFHYRRAGYAGALSSVVDRSDNLSGQQNHYPLALFWAALGVFIAFGGGHYKPTAFAVFSKLVSDMNASENQTLSSNGFFCRKAAALSARIMSAINLPLYSVLIFLFLFLPRGIAWHVCILRA